MFPGAIPLCYSMVPGAIPCSLALFHVPWRYSIFPGAIPWGYSLFRPKLSPNQTKNGIFGGQKIDYFQENFCNIFEVAEEGKL